MGLGLCALIGLGCPAAPLDDDDVVDTTCDDVWGPEPSTGRAYVRAGADGDGTRDAPYGTLTEALAATAGTAVRQIVLWPGEYPGRYDLDGTAADPRHNGLEIAGCGRDATELVGIEGTLTVNEMVLESIQPVLAVFGPETRDIVVRDLALVGGRRAFFAFGGAGASGPIVLQQVDVRESERIGVLVDGTSTLVRLDDVVVDTVEPEGGAFGWGISIQTNQWFGAEVEAATELVDVAVRGATGVGIFAHGGWVALDGVSVDDTGSSAETMGRGVHLQQFTRGSIDGLLARGNKDAAVFLESPGRPVIDGRGGFELNPLDIIDSELGPTDAAETADGASTGDGLTVTQFVGNGNPADAGSFLVTLEGTTFTGNVRQDVLAEAVTLQVGGNNIFGKGSAYPLASQAGAIVEGIGGGPPGAEPTELGVPGNPDALDLLRDVQALDEGDG